MKTTGKILVLIGLIAFLSSSLFAQTPAAATSVKSTGTTVTTQGKFTDDNKNGVCDKHESKAACAPGKNFVDKNGDGKCDNCGSTGTCKGGQGNCAGKGTGAGCGKGTGDGCGKGPGCGKGAGAGCGNGGGKGNCCGAKQK